MGKYDFQQQSVPYGGITEACRRMCEHLLQHGLSQVQMEELRTALGSSIHVLQTLLPNLLKLIGMAPVQTESAAKNDEDCGAHDGHFMDANRVTSVEETQNLFRFALSTVIRVLASWSPLVIVLDDLQWADSESFHLLESLLADPNLRGGFMLAGCFRNDEVDDTHVMVRWKRRLESADSDMNALLTNFELNNLSVEAVNQMLMDVLSIGSNVTAELATVLHKKTFGNPFDVIQFLNFLHEKHVLNFHLGTMKWTWDIDDIETRTGVTRNVVDLLQKSIQELPSELSEILSLAACLGATFAAHILAVVVDVFQQQRV